MKFSLNELCRAFSEIKTGKRNNGTLFKFNRLKENTIMRISIRQLKQIIKEQVEEGWSDKEDFGPRGPALPRERGRESQRGGWTDKDRNPKVAKLKKNILQLVDGDDRPDVSDLIDKLIAELE